MVCKRPALESKNRLRRASFFDQQERRAAEEAASSAKPVPQQQQPQPEPAWANRQRNDAEFMFRPAGNAATRKPAFQS